ncbi:MAG: peptidase, partial [Chitinophagaceae bacterium]
LMEGAKWWNQAFEAAGFINAFQVKLLPDDADPMDLRYNMINWVHRATRGWSYGYAVVDPRTGEILKGNVTLGSLRVRQDYMIAQGLLAPFTSDSLQGENRMMKMALQRLKQLAAHEIGHTLGIMHNYIASSEGRASVMDYPPPVVQLNSTGELDLTNAYTNEIGDWDKVTINYGYREFTNGSNEKAELNKILTDAQSKGLTFISDRDARDPAGLHPTAHLWDNGTDAVTELQTVLKVRAKALSTFGINNIRKGAAMATLEDVLVPIYLFHRYQAEAASKVIGGMKYTYALKGDGQVVTAAVPKEDQLKALNSLLDCMDPTFLEIPAGLVKMIPPRPADYEYDRELFPRKAGLAFDPLAAAESAADLPISLIMNVSRLNRIAEYEFLYNGPGVDEVLTTIINRLFPEKGLTGFQGLIQQQNQQLFLTYLLAGSTSENASFATRGALIVSIDKLKAQLNSRLTAATDNMQRGSILLALERMKSPDKAKPSIHLVAPPGAPIGCGF